MINSMHRKFILLTFLLLGILQLSFGQISKLEKQDYLTARGMFDDEMYELALQQFQNFLQKYPGSALKEEVHFLLAECYFYLAQYPEAIKKYQDHQRDFANGTLVDEAKPAWRMSDRTPALTDPAPPESVIRSSIPRISAKTGRPLPTVNPV